MCDIDCAAHILSCVWVNSLSVILLTLIMYRNGVGLWLDEELFHGRTEPCQAFNNQPLTSNGSETFALACMEVYGFN